MSDENSLSDSASVSKDSDKQKSSSITKNLQKAFSKLKKVKLVVEQQ